MPCECSIWTCNDARSKLNCETRRGECEGFLICSVGIQIFLVDLSSNQHAPTHTHMDMMMLIDCDEQTTKWCEKEKEYKKLELFMDPLVTSYILSDALIQFKVLQLFVDY